MVKYSNLNLNAEICVCYLSKYVMGFDSIIWLKIKACLVAGV